MITKEIVYNVKCDNCGELFEQDYSGWNEIEFVVGMAIDDNWDINEDTDKHYCPNCYEYDDDDNLVIKGGQNG